MTHRSSHSGIQRSLLYTPTHRDAVKCLEDRFKEAQWVSEQPGRQAILCVIERSISRDISRRHRQALASPNFPSQIIRMHLSESSLTEFVNHLLDTLPVERRDPLRRLLLPNGISYGAGPNAAYLIGAALQCQTVHRRDSDVYLDPAEPGRFPIEIELDTIDHDLRPGCEQDSPAHSTDTEIHKVAAVGTNTFGDPTVDRRDLIAAGLDYLAAYQALGRPGIPPRVVRAEAIRYLVDEPATRHDEDFTSVELAGAIEAESYCVSWVTSTMPEMPTGVLGCDYMTLNMANLALHASVYHSRKMNHRYDTHRKSNSTTLEYSLRDLQYLQMGRLCALHNARLKNDAARYMQGTTLNTPAYVASFRLACAESQLELARVRIGAVDVYRAAAKAAQSIALKRRLQRVAAEIEKRGDQLDNGVIEAVTDFVDLLESWPLLICNARNLEDYVLESFQVSS